jgi:hypothetical protein
VGLITYWWRGASEMAAMESLRLALDTFPALVASARTAVDYSSSIACIVELLNLRLQVLGSPLTLSLDFLWSLCNHFHCVVGNCAVFWLGW